MTLDESQFSDKAPLAHLISIYTADGTPMLVSHKGIISFPSLLSVGQLFELGVDILFINHGVNV